MVACSSMCSKALKHASVKSRFTQKNAGSCCFHAQIAISDQAIRRNYPSEHLISYVVVERHQFVGLDHVKLANGDSWSTGHIHFWSLDAVAFKCHLRESKNKGDSTRRAVLSISGISHHQAQSGAADWLHSRGSRCIMGDFAEIESRKNRGNIVSKGTRNRASEHFDNCLHCSSSTFPTFRSFRAAKLYVSQSKTREKLNWHLFPIKISSKPNFGVN